MFKKGTILHDYQRAEISIFILAVSVVTWKKAHYFAISARSPVLDIMRLIVYNKTFLAKSVISFFYSHDCLVHVDHECHVLI